jgi:hypothetical protein
MTIPMGGQRQFHCTPTGNVHVAASQESYRTRFFSLSIFLGLEERRKNAEANGSRRSGAVEGTDKQLDLQAILQFSDGH